MEQDEIEHSSNHIDPSDTNSAHGRMNTNNEMQADQKNKKTTKHSLDYRSIFNLPTTQMSFNTIKRHYVLNHGLCNLLTTTNMHRSNIRVLKRKKNIDTFVRNGPPGSVTLCC